MDNVQHLRAHIDLPVVPCQMAHKHLYLELQENILTSVDMDTSVAYGSEYSLLFWRFYSVFLDHIHHAPNLLAWSTLYFSTSFSSCSFYIFYMRNSIISALFVKKPFYFFISLSSKETE